MSETPKKPSRLHFTKEEQENQPRKKGRKAKAKVMDVAQAKEKPSAMNANKPGSEPTATRLQFTEPTKAKQRLSFEKSHVSEYIATCRQVGDKLTSDQTDYEPEQDNVAVEAVETGVQMTKRMSESTHQFASRLKQHRTNERIAAEKPIDAPSSNDSQRASHHQPKVSNVQSRNYQKQNFRNRIRAKFNGSGNQSAKTVAATSNKTRKRAAATVKQNPKGMLILALGFLLVFVMNSVVGCVPIVQTTIQAFVIGTYPAEEDDVKAAERAYKGMEDDLKQQLAHYEANHSGYDEYRFELDEIWHDPHALIAIISARHNGEEWTLESAYPTLETYFDLQYILTETVSTETRYRTETQNGYRDVVDPDTGEITKEPYQYEVEVQYEYTVCMVTLENKNLSHLPVYSMSRTQLGLYALYMSTLGNMPDIFRHNPYASKLTDPLLHEVPQEYLDADPQFAALLAEAELYIGYPYVWGGDSPETSFDCSGFISWVFTNSGVYNTGRLGATSLYGVCKPVRADEAKPGDLVFFEGTISGEDGITHVGLYVGDGMMLHCGNPISYADLSDSYWQSHFFGYGRIPY